MRLAFLVLAVLIFASGPIHAADTVTRRSRTGFLMFLNSALVCWLSRKQTSVESSSFGAEFVAMKLCCENLRGLRYPPNDGDSM